MRCSPAGFPAKTVDTSGSDFEIDAKVGIFVNLRCLLCGRGAADVGSRQGFLWSMPGVYEFRLNVGNQNVRPAKMAFG